MDNVYCLTKIAFAHSLNQTQCTNFKNWEVSCFSLHNVFIHSTLSCSSGEKLKNYVLDIFVVLKKQTN